VSEERGLQRRYEHATEPPAGWGVSWQGAAEDRSEQAFADGRRQRLAPARSGSGGWSPEGKAQPSTGASGLKGP
jgi:hypothetical protein